MYFKKYKKTEQNVRGSNTDSNADSEETKAVKYVPNGEVLVSEVKPTKKNNRWSVFMNGQYLFAICDEIRQKYNVYKNQKLDEKIVVQILHEDEVYRGKGIAMLLIQRRLRSSQEIRQKLKEKKISDAAIVDVIKALEEYNFVDDKEFATAFVNTKLITKKIGKNKLSQELYRKGIKSDEAKLVLNNIDEETELQNAVYTSEKKLKLIRHTEPKKIEKTLITFLQGRGFSWDIIKKVLVQLNLRK